MDIVTQPNACAFILFSLFCYQKGRVELMWEGKMSGGSLTLPHELPSALYPGLVSVCRQSHAQTPLFFCLNFLGAKCGGHLTNDSYYMASSVGGQD